jgi:hypothetical protein
MRYLYIEFEIKIVNSIKNYLTDSKIIKYEFSDTDNEFDRKAIAESYSFVGVKNCGWLNGNQAVIIDLNTFKLIEDRSIIKNLDRVYGSVLMLERSKKLKKILE